MKVTVTTHIAVLPNDEDIAEVAGQLYTKYCQSVGGKAFNGDPLPTWEVFSQDASKLKQVHAWMDVANEAIQIICSSLT
jgi:hypothetical protein